MINNLRDKIIKKQDVLNERDNKIKEIEQNDKYTKEAKEESINTFIDSYNNKITAINNDIKDTLGLIQNKINDVPNLDELNKSAQYLITMSQAQALNEDVINSQINKYKGKENSLVYLRQCLKNNDVDTAFMNNYIFADYSGESVSPASEYFDYLVDYFQGENSYKQNLYRLRALADRANITSFALDKDCEEYGVNSGDYTPPTSGIMNQVR